METSLDERRRRPRQGRFVLQDGVPLPDPESSLAVLHGKVIGGWLHRNAPLVSGKLLDVGCGNRPYAAWYERLVDDVVATDMVAAPGVAVCAPADCLPFRTGTFDTVLMTEVLEHVRDADLAVAEIARVLRPGGHLLVTVPFLYPMHEPPFDFRRFTHFGLIDVLERSGFEVLDVDAKGGPGLMVAHYVTLAMRLGLMSAGRTANGDGLLRHPWARALVTRPQQALAPLIRSQGGVQGMARYASLGYMAAARRR